MNSVQDYDVLVAFTVNQLIKMTKEHMKEGWIPWGGIAVLYDKDSGTTFHYQSIAKHDHYNQSQ